MKDNFTRTKEHLGYTTLHDTPPSTYTELGMKCGLEVHQQLKTEKKLFCNCPAGIYQKKDEYDAEIIRHMRPTLSEMGGYDGTALMEFKTKKNITYRIANKTTCTYDIDDTPPFKLNRQALDIAMEVALLLKSNIVGELHITRKQYLDGSIPAGFQRTGIVSIEGTIPLKNKNVGIIQMSIEEDSCREVSDSGHNRIYTTDRLGMPLIETVTYPHMLTPDEAAEAANYIRFLNRSTGKVRTGIGAAREDVNVSISGGTRVEIKGVSHIKYIPALVHNEAFRQKSLLCIKDSLSNISFRNESWKIKYLPLEGEMLKSICKNNIDSSLTYIGVNLPGFKNILSCFTQPKRMFAEEISDRLKVIACIDKPNMVHSEDWSEKLALYDFTKLAKHLCSKDTDAQIILWGSKDDIKTALETIEERCIMAFHGVPNETRKSFKDGTTMFERVLPGADRMYPDTDSAPIPITDGMIKAVRNNLPDDLSKEITKLVKWNAPMDTHRFILKNKLVPLIEAISAEFGTDKKFLSTLIGHRIKNLLKTTDRSFDFKNLYCLFTLLDQYGLDKNLLYDLVKINIYNPHDTFATLLKKLSFKKYTLKELVLEIPHLRDSFSKNNHSHRPDAEKRWIMSNLRRKALGNISLSELSYIVDKGGKNHE